MYIEMAVIWMGNSAIIQNQLGQRTTVKSEYSFKFLLFTCNFYESFIHVRVTTTQIIMSNSSYTVRPKLVKKDKWLYNMEKEETIPI